jgi:hypothetical protein
MGAGFSKPKCCLKVKHTSLERVLVKTRPDPHRRFAQPPNFFLKDVLFSDPGGSKRFVECILVSWSWLPSRFTRRFAMKWACLALCAPNIFSRLGILSKDVLWKQKGGYERFITDHGKCFRGKDLNPKITLLPCLHRHRLQALAIEHRSRHQLGEKVGP